MCDWVSAHHTTFVAAIQFFYRFNKSCAGEINTVHLFIPTPTQLLWEAFNHAAITARRLFVHISIYDNIARYSFTLLIELWQRGVNEIAKGSKRQQEDSNPGSLD